MPVSNRFRVGDLGRMIFQYHSANKIDVLKQEHVSDVYLSPFSLHIVHCIL